MDAAAVQAVVDAAVAQAAAQHQADLAAANAANAIALQQAIAALPVAPAAGAVAAAGAPAAVFALTPGLANPGQPWDYTMSEGLRIYTHASAKLLDTTFMEVLKLLRCSYLRLGSEVRYMDGMNCSPSQIKWLRPQQTRIC
jgi:hypothetical protein